MKRDLWLPADTYQHTPVGHKIIICVCNGIDDLKNYIIILFQTISITFYIGTERKKNNNSKNFNHTFSFNVYHSKKHE